MNKAAALEKEIEVKWQNSTETGSIQVGLLVHEDYEKWDSLMKEVLVAIKNNIDDNKYNNLMNEQNTWEQKRNKRDEELRSNHEMLGLNATYEAASYSLAETEKRTYHLINTYF